MNNLINRIFNRARFTIQQTRRRVLHNLWGLPEIELNQLADLNVPIVQPFLDDIALPPYGGPKDHDDYEPFMRIIQKLQPQIVVELGTAHGNTVAHICHQCPEAKVYTVNALPEKITGTFTTFALTQEDIGRSYRKHGYESRVKQIFENTLHLDLSKYFSSACVDLGIIDACHDTDYVVNDFHKLQPFMAPGGIILLHDTHPSMEGHLSGSYLACIKLRRQGYDIRHIANTWWGIWVNK